MSSIAFGGAAGQFTRVLCERLGQARSFQTPQPLSAESVILDTNIPLMSVVQQTNLFEILNRADLRTTSVARKEMIEHHAHPLQVFALDSVPESTRTEIAELLEKAGVGGPKGFKDRMIVAEIFCAKSVNGPPVFVTRDSGVYGKLFRLSSEWRNVPSSAIPGMYFPRGFTVKIGGRVIRVIPVDPRTLSSPPN